MQPVNNIVILGAGPAGIAAAIALKDQATVLDSRADVGGLSGTIHLDGAVVDWGGHSFHTPHPAVRELVFHSLEMYEQQRDARCYTSGTMIPYPFQIHFRAIGNDQITTECEVGLAITSSESPVNNFEEYIHQQFGAGIAKHFMLPYNQKLWGKNLSRMAADWTGERVASAKETSDSFPTTGGKRKPLQTGTSVAYPARGGFSEIIQAMANKVSDLRFQKKVIRICPDNRKLYLSTGEVLPWKQLISTIPIDRLPTLIDSMPRDFCEEAKGLEKLSLALCVIVIGHPIDTPIQRIYSADPVMPAHKIALNHNSSPYLRALPHHGIVAEISYSESEPLVEKGLTDRVISGLLQMGIIQSLQEVQTSRIYPVPYAYPVPTKDRDAIVSRMKTWLEERGIYSLGRFGEWAYINSDEAMHRGLHLGESLMSVRS